MLVLNAAGLCSARLIQKNFWDLHFHEESQQEESGATVACIFCIEKFQKWPGRFSFQHFDFIIRLSPEQRAIVRKCSETIIFFWRFSLPNLCDSPRQLGILVVYPQVDKRTQEFGTSVPFGAAVCSSFLFSRSSIFLPSDHDMFTSIGRCGRER